MQQMEEPYFKGTLQGPVFKDSEAIDLIYWDFICMKAHFKTISLNKNYTPDKFKIRIRISHNKQQLVILDLDKGPKFSRI